MAVMGTFSSFTTARLGIYASQASLNVTGNNIANINTKGYTRQRMDLVSLYAGGLGKYANSFDKNIGYGVLCEGATQLRDKYLDIRYRNENTKLSTSEEKLDGLNQISHILDEVGKGTGNKEGFGVIQAQFGSLFEALEQLKVNVGSQEYDDLVRTEAGTLTTYFNKAAQDLKDIYDIKSKELKESVNEVNKLLKNIRDLNDQIRTAGIYGEKALELRDARNNDIDTLSEYLGINVEYSMERIDQFNEVEKLTITLANSKGPDGKPIKLVDGIFGAQISIPEEIPVQNPDYDPAVILKAIEDARKESDTVKNAVDVEPWLTKFKEAEAKRADAEKKAEDENPIGPDTEWQAKIDEAEAKAREAAEKKYPADDPDRATKIEADVKAAGDKVRQERQDIITAAGDQAVNAAKKEVEAERQAAIEQDVQKAKEEAIEKSGKYQLKGDPTKFTNDPALAETADNIEALLVQVGPLKDHKDRLMDDPNSVSKKSEEIGLNDVVLTGKLQAMRETLTEEGEYASQFEIDDPQFGDADAAIKRGVPYYQKALDNLAKKLAEVFNAENQLSLSTVYNMTNGDTFKDADGKDLGIKFEDITEVLRDKNGDPVKDADGNDIIVFKQNPTPEQAKQIATVRANAQKDPIYGFYDGGVLFSNGGNNDNPNDITAANISISTSWSNGSVRVLNDKRPYDTKEDGSVIESSSRNENIQHLISLYDKQLEYLATDVDPDSAAISSIFKGNFREVFTSISGILADDTQDTTGKVVNYSISALSLDNDRLSVSGVDLNDEATNMMQFSKSYSAACRLLTTIDSMLDKLINGTAI